jgi:hypothetical protein
LTEEGDLLIETAAGEIRQRRPFVYQEREGAREEVGGSFAVTGSRVTFTVGPYDRSRTLVIDPQVGYSTYIGGNRDDQGFFAGLAVDGEGNAYVSGETNSATGLLSGRTTRDAFVAKIDPKGERLLFLMYLGGRGDDRAFDVFADGAGSVYLTGTTSSPDFTGADPSGYVSIPPFLVFDAFLVKLSSSGALVYSRYFGLGSGFAVAADGEGNAYLSSAGSVSKFDPSGRHLATASFINEGSTTTRDLRLDAAGNIYATGQHAPTPAALANAFVARVSADLGSAAFVPLPSSGGEDRGWGLATDGAGNVYVAGETNPDPNLPSQKMDAFVATLAPDLSLARLTRIGGSDLDQGRGVAADGSGSLYLTGFTISPDFPTKDPFTTPSRLAAIFVMKLNADTSEVVWSTLIGGNAGTEAATIAVDGSENVYVQGRTSSTTGLIGPGGLQPTFGGGVSDIFLIQIKQEVNAEINVLPSPTRWKPQRSDDPIVVDFEGPKGLKPTTTLEIKDSTGNLLANPNLAFAVVGDQSELAKYNITWSGPWTREVSPGVTERLPYGDYTFVVKGMTKDDKPLDSDPTKPCTGAPAGAPSCSKVSLVEVTGIRFEPADGGSALDSNPAVEPLPGESAERGRSGDGGRIFPEALEPVASNRPAPKVFDAVRVIAALTPKVSDTRPDKPVRIFFRAIDVDDPSAGGGSIDDEGKEKDNQGDFDKAGNALAGLFKAVQGATPDAAIGAALDKIAESDGAEAWVTLQVSRRQGDNYRVAASTSEEWVSPAKLRALQKTDVSGKEGLAPGALEHTTREVLVEGRQVSEMLTVWRTLHLEVDRLVSDDMEADQARMDVRGNFTKLMEKSLEDETGPFRNDGKDVDRERLGHWVLHEKDNDWKGANLRVGFHASDVYNVTLNGKKSVDVEVKSGQADLRNRLTEQQVDGLDDKCYVLQDEEIDSLGKSADYRLATALFAKAYIQTALMPQSEQETRVPFVISRFHKFEELEEELGRQLDRRNMMLPANYSLEAQGRSTSEYWSVQLVSAFDGNPEGDFDPQEEFNIRERATESRGNLGHTTLGSCFDGVIKIGGCKPHASIFVETIRDLFTKPPRTFSDLASEGVVNQRATAHELLHSFNVVHDEAIMCANVLIDKGPAGGLITEKHLKTLRELGAPTVSRSKQQTCK